jgi:hypothetical protein
MKVQIEIPQKALNLAVAQIMMMAKDEDSTNMVNQAFERCNNEVTDLNIDEYDEDMSIRTILAWVALVQRGSEIEKEERQ